MRPPVTLRLLAAIAACAAGPAAAASSPGVDHGAQIAASRCAACHQIGAEGPSPNPSAPAFGRLGLRYNSIALEKKMMRIRKQGHLAMPPQALPESEAEDLVAYIGSLRSQAPAR
jgi:mono/diheme cytochrome c family protein